MAAKDPEALKNEITKLKAELAEREASMPIHSARAHQLMEIEDLEERIEALEKELSA